MVTGTLTGRMGLAPRSTHHKMEFDRDLGFIYFQAKATSLADDFTEIQFNVHIKLQQRSKKKIRVGVRFLSV